MTRNSLRQIDMDSLVHQQSDLDAVQRTGAMLIDRGEGIFVYDTEGKDYLEAMAGLWSASLGFSQPRLAKAAHDQMLKLPFYHTFFGKGHTPAVELAERLLEIAPKTMARVLFQCSGSEANDAAIKLAWYYHAMRGAPQKRKLIGRTRGYHGNTVATASLSGQPHMYEGFGLPLPGFIHADNPNVYQFAFDGESEETFSKRMADRLEALIQAEGPETIAAMFVEPVQGGGGAITPPRGYFEAIQPVLRRHDILLVADEVICGFGRTGEMWGSSTYGIDPDMMSCAKQLSAAYQPISALMISHPVHEALLEGSRRHGSFGHGFTYGGHPVACAVAIETLNLYRELDILSHVKAVSPIFLSELGALLNHPLVGDVRGVGLIAGVQLMQDPAAKLAFPAEMKIGARVEAACLEAGLIVRAIGDRVAFTPPLIISAEEVRDMCGRFAKGLDRVLESVKSSMNDVPLESLA